MSEHALMMPSHALALGAPAAMVAAAAANAASATPAGAADGELSDDDLEHVVGGLARAWYDHASGDGARGSFPL